MNNSNRVVFNGKFLSAEMTGVHRVAYELLRALNEHSEATKLKISVAEPRNRKRALCWANIDEKVVGPLTGQFWEQFDLPRFVASDELLVSLCNLGPLATRHTITMIHDAQVFLTPRSYSFAFRTWYRFALPLFGRRHRRILTVSNYSREQLALFGVAPLDKIDVIHNGVDHILRVGQRAAILQELGLSERGYVCALSNTQAHKNIGVLLDAFARSEMSQQTLVLIGSADQAAFRSQGFDSPRNVVFAGRVSDAELRSLMENALCFALPSKTEGFGLPPLESMALGVPAICAPCGAVPEVCADAALYADADDPAEWAAQIINLSKDDQQWRLISEKGQTHASAFTWKRAAQELMSVIDRELNPSLSRETTERPIPSRGQMGGSVS